MRPAPHDEMWRTRFVAAIALSVLILCGIQVTWAADPLLGAAPYKDDVRKWRQVYLPDVAVSLLAGQIRQESQWKPDAASRVGARGLLQIMPGTAKDIAKLCGMPGFDPLIAKQAIKGGLCYDGLQRKLVTPMASPDDLNEAMFRGYNGGSGYIIKEKREAYLRGDDHLRAGSLPRYCHQFRTAEACQENLGYYPAITRWARQLYGGW